MKNWLHRVSLDLLDSESLPPREKLFSAITVLCCLYTLRQDKYIHLVKEDVQIALLRMVALRSDGAMHYQYLRGEMHQDNSQLVDVYTNASYVQFNNIPCYFLGNS